MRKATVVMLGVNVDHVATLRQARGVGYPDPIDAALEAEAAGADGVTVHLREDRRHIQDADLERLRAQLRTKLNLEMAATTEMKAIALRLRPADVCIVPERRQELTTEGGLDVRAEARVLDRLIGDLRAAGIRVSLFIDPHPEIVAAAAAAGASHVELHTGAYSAAAGAAAERELARLRDAATAAHTAGLVVNGGHGLTYANVRPVARLPHLNELNIGHSIVARAVFVGIGTAVREMKDLLR